MSRVVRGGKVVPASVVEAQSEAEAILASARKEAEGIRAAAEDDAERWRNEARAEGIETARSESAALLLRARRHLEETLREGETSLIELASTAAQKIVRAELSLSPERVRDIARDLLARVRHERALRLCVHPDDAPLVEELAADHGATLETDAGLQRGDCVVRTAHAHLDARIDVQLDALERALRDR